MKDSTSAINNHPKYERLIHWGKQVFIVGGSQAIVQIAVLISGIIVIRQLPTQEYAWYTLANTTLGAMTLLADGGISTGVMAQGGKVWQNQLQLGTVLATGLALRKKFAIISMAIVLPVLSYLLYHHNANWLTILLTSASLIPAFLAALSDSLLEIIPKLHQDIKPLQKNQIIVNIGRLVLTFFSLLFLPFTFVAIIASGLPRLYGNIGLRKIAYNNASKHQKPDLVVQKNLMVTVKKILPGAIYYSFSGQITIWLISIFGNTSALAEVGALVRLSAILNVIAILFTTLIIPRFARSSFNKGDLLAKYIQTICGVILICFFIVVLTWLFPGQILWILGKNYSQLNHQLFLSMFGSCLGVLWGIVFSLNSSRGWIMNPLIPITIDIITIIVCIQIFNVSTINGILSLNIFVSLILFILHTCYGLIKIYGPENNIEYP